MKIYELEKGDEFVGYLHDPDTDERVLTMSGTFIGMDGACAKVQLFGIDEMQYLSATFNVERVDHE